MTPGATSIPPPIIWAQRTDKLFVTIEVECKDPEFKFTDETLYFKGTGLPGNKLYEVSLNFLNKINPDNVTFKNTNRNIEFIIPKEKSGPYWPKLTTDARKLHFVKVDFDKWDEEDHADWASDDNFENQPPQYNKDFINSMLSEKKDYEGFDDLDSDSDSDVCPGLLD